MTSFTCPRCGWTSYNPHDVAERYCGHCHVFVDDPLLVTQGVGFARVDERDGVLDPFARFGQEPDWSDGQFQRDGVLDIRRISADKDRE